MAKGNWDSAAACRPWLVRTRLHRPWEGCMYAGSGLEAGYALFFTSHADFSAKSSLF